MKKILFFIGISFGISCISSCQREYTCTCTNNLLGSQNQTVITAQSKDEALTQCKKNEGYVTTCTIQ